ncbi:MAG: DciA family protein [Patescibacteria group bacterium]|nr:DciA family protein [Patescibacteria group bacterium]
MIWSIGSLLNKSLKRQGIESQVKASQVIKTFHKIIERKFGQKVLEQLQAKSLKNKTLVVAILSSVVASEIRLHQEEIIEEINSQYKKTLVEKLRFLF